MDVRTAPRTCNTLVPDVAPPPWTICPAHRSCDPPTELGEEPGPGGSSLGLCTPPDRSPSWAQGPEGQRSFQAHRKQKKGFKVTERSKLPKCEQTWSDGIQEEVLGKLGVTFDLRVTLTLGQLQVSATLSSFGGSSPGPAKPHKHRRCCSNTPAGRFSIRLPRQRGNRSIRRCHSKQIINALILDFARSQFSRSM